MPSRFEYERAIRHSELPAPARHLALTIATWADVNTGVIPDRFQPSISVLSISTGMHEATVKRHLKTLVDTKWTVREVRRQEGRRDNDITRTILTIPAGASVKADEEVGAQSANPTKGVGAERAKGGRTERQGVSAQDAGGGRTVRHKSSVSTGSTGSASSPPASGATQTGTNTTLFDVEEPPKPITAQTVIAEWISRIGYTPTDNTVARVGKEAKGLLQQGHPVDVIVEAAAAWSADRYAKSPTAIPQYVDKVLAQRANVVQMPANRTNTVGGTRSEIPSNEYWDTITDEELRNIL